MMIKYLQNHPATIYVIVWSMVILLHTIILNAVYDLPFILAFADSVVFNIVFSVISFGLWYMVRFSNLQSKSPAIIMINHLFGVTVTLTIWILLSFNLLHSLFTDYPNYVDFLRNSLVFRGISGVFYYAIIVSLYYLIINFRELQDKMKHESELNALLKEAELNMLRSQIRPHFLFNSLNSISSLTITDPLRAQEMVIKLSDFMRFSLDFKEEKLIPLEKEIYHIQLYFDIEKIRFGSKLCVTYNLPPTCMKMMLPALILQPLAENSVKFGLYETTGKVNIVIEAECEEGFLVIKTANDYDPDGNSKKGTGLGLRNIRSRLEKIYNRNDLITISKGSSYFEVVIKFPQHA